MKTVRSLELKKMAGTAALLAAAAAIAIPAQAAPPSGNWTMTFNEDFNSIDGNKWTRAFPTYNSDGTFRFLDGRTRELAYYPDSNVTTQWDSGANSNVARIRAAREDTWVSWENRTYNYTSGVLESFTKFKQKYGYFEARVKTFNSSADGYITDFWLASASNTYKWPPEIDIYETSGIGNAGKAHIFNHYRDSGGVHRSEGREKTLDASQWHTYACNWQPGSIQWYVDGVAVGSPITANVPNEDMFMLLSAEVKNDNNGWFGIPGNGAWPQYMYVDYVKVWRNNNVASNPSFDANNADTQTPSGWSEYTPNNTANASFVEAYGGSNSGARHLTHWSGSAYQVYTYQTRTGLSNGNYTVKAWVRSSGGQNSCRMEAKDYGGARRDFNIGASSGYKQIVMENINVTNGQCTIGFWSNGNANNWIYVDDVELFKQ